MACDQKCPILASPYPLTWTEASGRDRSCFSSHILWEFANSDHGARIRGHFASLSGVPLTRVYIRDMRYEMWMNTPPFLPCRVLLFNSSVTQSPCGISRVCGQMMLIQSRQILRQNLLTPAVFDESPSSKPSCCEVLARLWLASTVIFKPGCTCFQC